MTPPETIWTEPPDIFDGMGLWYDTINPHPRLTEYRRADLVRRPAVKVKPLVWEKFDNVKISESAKTSFGNYYVEHHKDGGFYWWCPSVRGKMHAIAKAAAKAAAQADYESRILAALDLNGEGE